MPRTSALLLVLSCSLLACGSKAEGPAPKVSGEDPKDSGQGGDADALAGLKECKVDAECVLTGRTFEGSDRCCVSCGGHDAVNEEALDAFVATCTGKSQSECPKGGCAPPPPMIARCVENECTVVSGPVVTTTCATDADCSLANSVSRGEGACCPSCGDVAVNGASLADFEAWCETQTPLRDCPELHCVPGDLVTTCVDGQCRSGPAK